jgi:hypothetical protein
MLTDEHHNADSRASGGLMSVRRLLTITLIALIGAVGSACSAGGSKLDPSTSVPEPTPAAGARVFPVLSDDFAVLHDAGYTDAIDTFGESEVLAALSNNARIARIALADCGRWITGEMDSDLASLLSPDLLTRVQEELQLASNDVPSLLSPLPEDDGNGNNLAAAVRIGCDDSRPMRYDTGAQLNSIRVNRSGEHPQLEESATYAMHVAFGDTVVGTSREWRFTSSRTPSGWLLTEAIPSAQVNWFPASSD